MSLSISPNQTPARLNGLDTLRALAISLVFASHYGSFVSHKSSFGWFGDIGWVGVDLFFVLSGYLISNQIFAGIAQGQQLSLKAFFARRLLRTLPNYYVVLAAYFLFPIALWGKSPPELWRFLSFTQNIGLHPGTAFSHAWSLCVEEQFYLALPLALWVGSRLHLKRVWGWVVVFGGIAAGITLRSLLWMKYAQVVDGPGGGYMPDIYYATLCRADEFLPGIALAMLKNFHSRLWARLVGFGNRMLALAALASALMLYLALEYYQDDDGYLYFMTGFGYSLLAVCFALLVLAAFSPGSWLYRVRVPGAGKIALWSYAIYVSHKAVAMLVGRSLGQVGVDLDGWLAMVIVAAVCVVVGGMMFALVETPFMKLRQRWWGSQFVGVDVMSSPGARRTHVSVVE